jgi:hypothetical protein
MPPLPPHRLGLDARFGEFGESVMAGAVRRELTIWCA